MALFTPNRQIHNTQLAEQAIGFFLRAKEVGKKPSVEDVQAMSPQTRRLLQMWDQLKVYDGTLYWQYEPPIVGTPSLQLVVPETMKEEVLWDLHEGVMGGHLGEGKTLEKVKERFYWPGYHNDVKNWVNTCSDCAARKTPSPRNRAALQSIKVRSPMQLVAIDILGPLYLSLMQETHSSSASHHLSSCTWTKAVNLSLNW